MSIASRIEQIKQHLTDDYSVLEVAGADLTNIDKNIVNLKPTWQERLLYFMDNGTEEVWNNWEKVIDEGTELTLNNTLEAKMKIELKGNTYQEGTPTPETPQDIHVVSGDNTINICGKNLCPVSSSNFVPISTWSSLTGGNANTYTNGTKITLNSGTYTITFSERTNIDGIQVNGLTPVLYGNGTFTIDTKTDIYIRVKAQNNSNPVILKTQLEKGSTATEFVSYKLQSYPINLGVENLFDNSLMVNWGSAIKYIPINVDTNTDYTLSTSNVGQGSSSANIFLSTANSGVSSSDNGVWADKPRTINSGNNNVIYVAYRGTEGDDTKYWYQLEKSSKANSYTPYGTTPIELCKTGDYQDYIYKDNKKWYLHKEIGKVVLDGTENWIRSGNTSESFFCGALAGVNIPFEAKMGTANDCKTNYFAKGYKISNAEVFDMYNGTDYYTTFALYLSTSRVTDITTFKNWLGTHNVILYYVLTTPTSTEITDTTLISQLEALLGSRSYQGQTNINQENSNLASILNATALQEM